MQTVHPEFNDLKEKVTELSDRMSKAEGEIQQINRLASDNTRQTIWQFVIFTVSMAGILIGMLNYQTNSIRNELNTRFDAMDHRIIQLEKRLDQRIDTLEKRMDSLERRMDIIAIGLEDLRKEVRNRKL